MHGTEPVHDGLRWIRDSRELEALVPAWSALWREDPRATPFQSPEWLMPWWRCFGADLHSVGLFHDEKLVGLLPFYRYVEPVTGERRLLPLGIGTSDYLDGLFAPECGDEEIGRALEFLCDGDDWDGLYITQLRAGSRLLRVLDEMGGGNRTRFTTESCSRMPATAMSELPRKIRRNAMYYRNRAHRAGHLECRLANASNWKQTFDELVRLHTERWQGSAQAGVFADERMIRWHHEALPLLCRAEMLRLYSLRLNEETTCVIYSLIDPAGRPGRTLYVYLPGYSVAHADLRPGTVLTAMVIEESAREGVRIIDLLRGDEEYKRLWHTEPVLTFGFRVGGRTGWNRTEIAAYRGQPCAAPFRPCQLWGNEPESSSPTSARLVPDLFRLCVR